MGVGRVGVFLYSDYGFRIAIPRFASFRRLAAGADDCGRHRAGDDQHGVDAEFLLPLETPPV